MNTGEEFNDLTSEGARTPTIPLRQMLGLSVGAVALMVVASLWTATRVPSDGKYPIHWGLDGKPDGYASLAFVLYSTPTIVAAMVALLAVVPRIEPRRFSLQQSAKAYCVLWMGLLVVLMFVHAAVLGSALGHPINLNHVILPLLGVLLMVVGNHMGKIQSNFTLGIRTPWTLSSELSWNKTHRLGGRLFFLQGLVILAASLIPSCQRWLLVIIVGGLIGIVLLLMGYSYVIWRSDPGKRIS